MKKLFMISTLLLSNSIIAGNTIVLNKSEVVSLETSNREIVTASSRFRGISIKNDKVEVKNDGTFINVELSNGEVQTIDQILEQKQRAKLTGGQDGGGG